MAGTSKDSDRWYFTKEQLENTPSRQCGIDAYKELQYRQQAASFIQEMGHRLQVSQLCINTAIVYVHRFYVFHSFTNFPWHQMAAAALFLAAKVEEQPRKLEYVIRVAYICKNPREKGYDITADRERYMAQSQDLVFNENVLLQTLGFDVAIDHPHTYTVKCCHLVRASKDLAQTSYLMASNSLHLTTMCIQYKPTVVACFCILLACKWSNWEIPLSTEKKEWYTYVDPTVTSELLQQLLSEFLVIFENCPSRLKEKIMRSQKSVFQDQEKKVESTSLKSLEFKGDDPHKHRTSRPPEASSSGHKTQEQREREYKERKEKERLAHLSGMHQGHHHRPGDPKQMKPHTRPPSSSATSQHPKQEPFSVPPQHREVKRDLLKPNVQQTDMNSSTNYRPNPLKPKPEVRRYEDHKAGPPKSDADVKKHLSVFDKNPYVKTSTSQQKVSLDKSVPPKPAVPKHFNGSNGSSYSDVKVKTEAPLVVKEEVATPAVIKRPSLFSPEQTPQPQSEPPKMTMPSLNPLSPITSPLPPSDRSRNYSSSSEPELRPTMKKIDQVEGFENLMRDSTIGIGPPAEVKREPSPVREPPLVNGLETNPTLISNLLKEATSSHIPGVASTTIKTETTESSSMSEPPSQDSLEREHHRHKSKKKKEKHKHKDKDKSKDDKEKKKKHKDKDREKHRHKERKEEVASEQPPMMSEPIKIKIQKDKIQPLIEPRNETLKIKIPKDKIKTEGIVDSLSLSQPSSGGLKIKIPKDIINNCNSSSSGLSLDQSFNSRKRDRERQSESEVVPPSKLYKSHKESKQNGRHSYSKVTHGDGDSVTVRLAESKYTKGSS